MVFSFQFFDGLLVCWAGEMMFLDAYDTVCNLGHEPLHFGFNPPGLNKAGHIHLQQTNLSLGPPWSPGWLVSWWSIRTWSFGALGPGAIGPGLMPLSILGDSCPLDGSLTWAQLGLVCQGS